jgi:hypothetical protein
MHSLSPHSCCMPCPSHPPWLHHSNYVWRGVTVHWTQNISGRGLRHTERGGAIKDLKSKGRGVQGSIGHVSYAQSLSSPYVTVNLGRRYFAASVTCDVGLLGFWTLSIVKHCEKDCLFSFSKGTYNSLIRINSL